MRRLQVRHCIRRSVPSWCGIFFLVVICIYLLIGTSIIHHHVIPISATRRNNDVTNLSNKTLDVFHERAGKPVRILFWTSLYHHAWRIHYHMDTECPAIKDKCYFTSDHSQYNDSDLVVFHMRNRYTLPTYRPRFQKWVFAIQESPMYTAYRRIKKQRWLFNITMTYKRLSDVRWNYGECTTRNAIVDGGSRHIRRNYADGKKHIVAWFVSHCRTQSRREDYVRELARSIDVHIYGCGGRFACPRWRTKYCDGTLLNADYKFYLSFENSLCDEYITEKLYRILELDVVPVVLGFSNYSRILPPRSFIDVRDFESPKAPAKYLLLLDRNDSAYNEYFQWKEQYKCIKSVLLVGCRLCEYALRERHRIQTRDVLSFWSKQSDCVSPDTFYGQSLNQT